MDGGSLGRDSLGRSRSRVVADEALAAVQAQSEKLVSKGISPLSFFLNVAVFGASAFTIGHFPQHYWLLSLGISSFYYSLRVSRMIEQQRHCALVEFCWVWNGIFLLCLAGVAANEFLGAGLLIPIRVLRAGFLIFFMIGVIFGGALVVVGDALVFHDVDHSASVFIHVSPMLSAWCLIGYVVVGDASEVASAYPALGDMLQGLITRPPAPWAEMVAPAACCYLAWWVPYTCWLMLGPDEHSLYMRDLHKIFSKLTGGSARRGAFVYCVFHLAASFFGFVFATFIFFTYRAYTPFVVAMLLVVLWKAASIYHYYLVEMYEKRLTEALEESVAPAHGRDAGKKGLV